MPSVIETLRTWTKGKRQTEAEAEQQTAATLATFVYAELDGRSLTATEAKQFAAMLDSGEIDETVFRSAVETERELRAAQAEVATCHAARLESKELKAAHDAELESRKVEDQRRKRVDDDFEQRYRLAVIRSNKLTEAQAKLKRCLPAGSLSALEESKAVLVGTRTALQKLQSEVSEQTAIVESLKTPERPLAPITPAEHLLAQHRQLLAIHDRELIDQQRQRDELGQLRARLAKLQATEQQQAAAHEALEKQILGG